MQWWVCTNKPAQCFQLSVTFTFFASLISIYISFRDFFSNGDYYIGGVRQGKYHGKGEIEWKNGDREIAYYVYNKREGKAKFYYKDGIEEDRLYKDGEIVE